MATSSATYSGGSLSGRWNTCPSFSRQATAGPCSRATLIEAKRCGAFSGASPRAEVLIKARRVMRDAALRTSSREM